MSSQVTAEIVKALIESSNAVMLEKIAELIRGSGVSLNKAVPEAAAVPEKKKKVKREKTGIPSTNPWIKFSVRVESVVRADEKAREVPSESKMDTTSVKQFASDLKKVKAYDEWKDEEIIAELGSWVKPAVSKQVREGTSKTCKKQKAAAEAAAKTTEVVAPVVVAEVPAPVVVAEVPAPVVVAEAKPAEVKPKAKKAKKEVAKPAETVVSTEVVVPTEEAPKPKGKAIQIKPKAAPAPVEKPLDLSFYSWTFKGEEYFTNDRGDVVNTEFTWVGCFDGTEIKDAPEPADLANAVMRE